MEEAREGPGRRAWIVAFLPALAVAVVAAVFIAREESRERNVGAPGTPVIFMLSPEHGNPGRLDAGERRALADGLRAASGLEVEVRVAATPIAAIEAFGGEADVGLLSLFEYLLARLEYGVEARLQVLRGEGADAYAGEILVRAPSRVRKVEDLAGKRIAYVDPHSTSGFIFPAKLLADAKVSVVPEFAGSHEKALERLREGEVDAAATYAGAAAGKPFRAIARTPPIPDEPVFFRRGFPEEKRERLAAALERVAATPEGRRLLGDVAAITGFKPATDAAYADVLAVIRAAGKTVYEVVPEGVRVESRTRGIHSVP